MQSKVTAMQEQSDELAVSKCVCSVVELTRKSGLLCMVGFLKGMSAFQTALSKVTDRVNKRQDCSDILMKMKHNRQKPNEFNHYLVERETYIRGALNEYRPFHGS
ncbi:hypothetical protein NKI74_29450 [Mesorhizobium sp. M0494]|uniref:hypothetical protein n=1 Tax=Mesorhizobium sp. M0494 TaxID=2956951 RepID=UPI003335C0BC